MFFQLTCLHYFFFLAMHEFFFGATACRIFFQTSFLHEFFWGIVNPPPVNTKGPPLTPQDGVGVEGQDEANHAEF